MFPGHHASASLFQWDLFGMRPRPSAWPRLLGHVGANMAGGNIAPARGLEAGGNIAQHFWSPALLETASCWQPCTTLLAKYVLDLVV